MATNIILIKEDDVLKRIEDAAGVEYQDEWFLQDLLETRATDDGLVTDIGFDTDGEYDVLTDAVSYVVEAHVGQTVITYPMHVIQDVYMLNDSIDYTDDLLIYVGDYPDFDELLESI